MTININIPQQWNDLNSRQLKKIVGYFNNVKPGKQLDILLFFALADTKWYQLKKTLEIFIIFVNIPISELKRHFKFLYEKTDLTKFIATIAGLEAPANRIGNITIDEFAHAEDFYLNYHKTNNAEYLKYLAAVLYRETKKHGRRTSFYKEELFKRAGYFDGVDANSLLSVLRAYQGSRQYLIDQFPKVFPKRKPSAKKTNQKPSGGLGDLILDLSAGKFGDYEKTRNINVYIFLKEFTDTLNKQQLTKKSK